MVELPLDGIRVAKCTAYLASRSFLDELKACVASDDIEGIVCLMAAVHIILVINAGKHKSSKVKEVAATVHRKLKTFMEITLEEDSIE
ncbi:condensin-2 complex subunit G2-like, partial [Piliocolobus tephrosceles]|uniref:condensin-2 complex subunit G2-like n=1 Tax=Piliocolobus tephrosceles TaxID=591936 RepID=UPI000E6AED68